MRVRVAINLSLAAILAGGVMAAAQGPREGMGRGMGSGMGGPGFGMHRPPLESVLGPHGAEGRWWNNPAVIDKLKLSEEQRKQMDEILLNHREKLIDMRAAVEKAELQLEPLVGADQPNEAQILGQIDKVAQARAELEKANARFLLALRAKLTPEQWKELKAWRDERRDQRMERMGRGERMPHGRGQDGSDGGRPQAPPPPGGPGPQGMMNGLPGAEMPDGMADTGTR
jgi:Spy/CpxP family protein refolding chaperone